eukprot:2672109-Amphidinium_carterae.1
MTTLLRQDMANLTYVHTYVHTSWEIWANSNVLLTISVGMRLSFVALTFGITTTRIVHFSTWRPFNEKPLLEVWLFTCIDSVCVVLQHYCNTFGAHGIAQPLLSMPLSLCLLGLGMMNQSQFHMKA